MLEGVLETALDNDVKRSVCINRLEIVFQPSSLTTMGGSSLSSFGQSEPFGTLENFVTETKEVKVLRVFESIQTVVESMIVIT